MIQSTCTLPIDQRPSLLTRLATHSRTDGDCLEWTLAPDGSGYGRFYYWVGGKRKQIAAHRAAWILLVGDIPEGLVIDHHCRNRRCVNTDHLSLVTPRANTRRGALIVANRDMLGVWPEYPRSSAATCSNGHDRAEHGYSSTSRDGYTRTHCRECGRDRKRRHLLRRAT